MVVTIGEKLLEKEVLSRDDMVELAGERPFKQVTTYEEFLDNSLSPEEKEKEGKGEEGEKGEKEEK